MKTANQIRENINNDFQESERMSLLGQLDAYERVREQARRAGNWGEYHACVESLAHISRLLILAKPRE